MVSEKIFKVFHIISLMGTLDPLGEASLDPRGLIGKIYVGDHWPLLHNKYISCVPHDFRVEDF